VVNRLLQDPRVDPSAQDNAAILEASGNGLIDVVNRLLQDLRVDPSAQDNQAIRWAFHNGRIDVVSRLLADDRVFNKLRSFSMFRGVSRVVFLEQLAKHHCKQFNINTAGVFCAGFVRKIRQNALIQRAMYVDSLPTVKSLIKREWQEVEKGIIELQKLVLRYLYRPDGPIALRLSRKWERQLQHRSR
jgi:hypothetical protein